MRERGRDIQQAYIHYQDDLLFKGPKTLFTFRARRSREGRYDAGRQMIMGCGWVCGGMSMHTL